MLNNDELNLKNFILNNSNEKEFSNEEIKNNFKIISDNMYKFSLKNFVDYNYGEVKEDNAQLSYNDINCLSPFKQLKIVTKSYSGISTNIKVNDTKSFEEFYTFYKNYFEFVNDEKNKDFLTKLKKRCSKYNNQILESRFNLLKTKVKDQINSLNNLQLTNNIKSEIEDIISQIDKIEDNENKKNENESYFNEVYSIINELSKDIKNDKFDISENVSKQILDILDNCSKEKIDAEIFEQINQECNKEENSNFFDTIQNDQQKKQFVEFCKKYVVDFNEIKDNDKNIYLNQTKKT